MRGLLCALLLTAGCRPGLDEDRRADLETLCADYCPRRVECVDDGWAKGDAAVCETMCAGEERYLLANECGEASFALLECVAALTCEALPAAVQALASGDEMAGCREEQVAQREACTFQVVR